MNIAKNKIVFARIFRYKWLGELKRVHRLIWRMAEPMKKFQLRKMMFNLLMN